MGREAAFGLSWSTALRLGRVSNLPTVWTNVLAAIVLARAAPGAWIALALFVALSFFYVAGMFLNDAFDRDFDKRFRPTRPIATGAARSVTVFAVGFGLLALGIALLIAIAFVARVEAGWRAPAAGAMLAAIIVLYDSWHKGNPFSPLLMALSRMLVYVIAGCAVATVVPARLLAAAIVAATYLIGLTYAAKQETLHRVWNRWPLLFLGVPIVYALMAPKMSVVWLPICALFFAVVGLAVWRLTRSAKADVGDAIRLLIAGISLLDGVFIAGEGRGLLAGVAALGFVLTLAAQRYIAGT